jgi:hypothetical protein
MIPAPLKRVALAVAVSMLCAPAAAQQNRDKVSLCTNWVAEAEHGGHYQRPPCASLNRQAVRQKAP